MCYMIIFAEVLSREMLFLGNCSIMSVETNMVQESHIQEFLRSGNMSTSWDTLWKWSFMRMPFACKYHIPFLWGNGKEFIHHEYLPSCIKYRGCFSSCVESAGCDPFLLFPPCCFCPIRLYQLADNLLEYQIIIPSPTGSALGGKKKDKILVMKFWISAFLISWSALVYSNQRCGCYLRNI